jgi:hypothetical protein
MLTLASLLLVVMGWAALSSDGAGMGCRRNQAKACGGFLIGWKMLRRLEGRVEQALAALHNAILGEAKMGDNSKPPIIDILCERR